MHVTDFVICVQLKKNTEIHLDTLYTHILYIHLIKTKNSVQTTL